jgi:uncharacterized protein (TIGR04222 family)
MQTALFFILFIAGILACLYVVVQYPNREKHTATEQPPELPDPYALKHFGEGYFALMRFTLLNLHARGYVHLSTNNQETKLGLKRTPIQDRPDEQLLDPVEKAVFRFIPNKAIDVQRFILIGVNGYELRAEVKAATKVYTTDWAHYGFIRGAAFQKRYKRLVIRLQLPVIAAGASYFITTIIEGANVTMVLAACLTALGAFSIGLARNKNVLNSAGKAYIDKLRLKYKHKKIKEIFTREEQVTAALLGSKSYTGSLLKSVQLYAEAYERLKRPARFEND